MARWLWLACCHWQCLGLPHGIISTATGRSCANHGHSVSSTCERTTVHPPFARVAPAVPRMLLLAVLLAVLVLVLVLAPAPAPAATQPSQMIPAL